MRTANPNGVLEEYAFFSVLVPMLSQLGPEGTEAFVRAGTELWASFGYTTAEDGRSSRRDRRGASGRRGRRAACRSTSSPIPTSSRSRDFIAANVSKEYVDRVRVGGCKLTIDGSPQGFTALRDRPYYDPVGDYPPGYAGYAAITMEQVQDAVDWCYENGIQIITHANGEGASDMLIAAIGAAQAKYRDAGQPPGSRSTASSCARTRSTATSGLACSRRSSRCTPSTGATGTATTPWVR